MRLRSLPAALLLAAACATVGGEPRYGKTAEDAFHAGEESLRKHDYPDATRAFEHVKNKYPFSKFAALSELRLADVKFQQDHFTEAAEAYRAFVKLHPGNDQVDYAAFRIALSHWRQAPSGFFLFPPTEEKDLTDVREAGKATDEFLKKYPDSKYRPEAEDIAGKARDMLADHEWYVAQFYAKRDRWAGTAGRLEALVKQYPGSRREPEALLQLADAYVKLDERFRAQQTLQMFLVKHPQDPRREQAERLLASLR